MSDKPPIEPDLEPQGASKQIGRERVPADRTETSRLSLETITVFLSAIAIIVTLILTTLAGTKQSANLILQLQSVRETRLEDVREAIGSNVNSLDSRLREIESRMSNLEGQLTNQEEGSSCEPDAC